MIRLAGEQLKREFPVYDHLPFPIRKALEALVEAELRKDRPEDTGSRQETELKASG